MASRLAWVFAAALACASPASASSVCEQGAGQKPDPAGDGLKKATDGKSEGGDDTGCRGGRRRDARRARHFGQAIKDIDMTFSGDASSLARSREELDKLDDTVAKLIKEGPRTSPWSPGNLQAEQAGQPHHEAHGIAHASRFDARAAHQAGRDVRAA
jgi:hypothetical protein